MLTIDGRAVDGPAAGFEEGPMRALTPRESGIAGARVGSGRDGRTERKDRVVHARFSATEMARIDDAAASAGLTISAFMRSLTLEGAGVRPFLTPEDRAILGLLLSDLQAVGVNLNQLARAANRREPGRPEAERAVIADGQRAVAALLLELRSFAARGTRMRVGRA
ncbi:plasmid mobilization relaxosome protein MobC [Pararhizobium sp. A13]|uniref:plasmid mobilization protein n=1 Tax=Pararhizobium sp. A13 TaxID=3133975 RepID=UPI00311AC50C